MAIVPSSTSIPLDLRRELPDAWVPWQISNRLMQEMKDDNGLYKKSTVLPTDTEWRFVWRYFHHDKPTKYAIKKIHVVHERYQQQSFEANLASIEKEASLDTFKPNWQHEKRADQRAQVIERWKQTTSIFSPFQSIEPGGRRKEWKQAKILPLWHGSSAEECASISTSGFVYSGKQANDPQSTDEEYFGSGIYFTNSARYAADIYGKGHLMMAWVSMREPFPVVGDPNQEDIKRLKGKGAYQSYNAHYAPIVSVDSDPSCSIYYSCQEGENPSCDEIVVFQKSQALPRFWIELEVELPYLAQPPLFVSEFIPHLLKILQNPQVDRDLKLRKCLNIELAILIKLKEEDDLEEKHHTLFSQLSQLLDTQGKINRVVRDTITNNQESPLPPPKDLNNNALAQSFTTQLKIEPKKSDDSYLEKIRDSKVLLKELKEIPLEVFTKALQQEPKNAILYVNLGRALFIQKISNVQLLNGTNMTQAQLYLKAIDLDPSFSMAYNNLGTTLPSGGSIQLLNGTTMTQAQLYLKAIDLDPSNSRAYNNLGTTLPSRGSTQLLNGTMMTKAQLYLKAIDLNPSYSNAYNNLGSTLPSGGSIQLLNGTTMTKAQLYLKAIDLDPSSSNAYYNLGFSLLSGESIQLLNGTTMTEAQLYLKAIDLDPSFSMAYNNLGFSLSSGESVQLLNGTTMTEAQLFLKAIDLDPSFSMAYNNLGFSLPSGGSVKLLNGTMMTKQQLLDKA